MIRLKWVESQFHADVLHVGVDMAGICPPVLGKNFYFRGFRKCISVQFKQPVKEF